MTLSLTNDKFVDEGAVVVFQFVKFEKTFYQNYETTKCHWKYEVEIMIIFVFERQFNLNYATKSRLLVSTKWSSQATSSAECL